MEKEKKDIKSKLIQWFACFMCLVGACFPASIFAIFETDWDVNTKMYASFAMVIVGLFIIGIFYGKAECDIEG